MAPPTSHSSLICLVLLSICLLLIEATSPPHKRPHSRQQRNVACGQSCVNTSDMTRCLRLACRKHAMGSLVRFGKRSQASSDLHLPFRASNREKVLEDLLLKDLLRTSQHQRGQLQSESTDSNPQFMPPVLLAGEPLLSHYPLPSTSSNSFNALEPNSRQLKAIFRKLSMVQPNDHGDASQLYNWLAQASRNIHQGELPLEDSLEPSTFQHAPVSSYQLQALQIGGDTTGASDDNLKTFLHTGHTQSHQRQLQQPGTISLGDFSPMNSQDLPSMLGKGLSSSDTEGYSHQIQRRRQKGLLKHLIRFG